MAERHMTTREQGREGQVWDPFREFRSSPFGNLFEDFFAPLRGGSMTPRAWLPRADVQETEKGYLISVSLPGVRKEDVKVDVRDDMLTISGERKEESEEKGKGWLRRETSYGTFSRSFVLPDGMHPEEIKASYHDGVLKLSIPKPQGGGRSRGVNVKID